MLLYKNTQYQKYSVTNMYNLTTENNNGLVGEWRTEMDPKEDTKR